jgi:hypothetical protein
MMPERTRSWLQRDQAAQKFRPKRIKLLLVGEAPSSDERFFYSETPGSDIDLFTQVCEVVFEATPSGDRTPYLKELRRRGVFAVDLKPDAPRRGDPLGPYVGPFLINLGVLGPDKIVFMDPEAYDAAYSKMSEAGLPVVDVRIPHLEPDRPETFRQKLRQALVRADLEKLIRPLPTPKRGDD